MNLIKQLALSLSLLALLMAAPVMADITDDTGAAPQDDTTSQTDPAAGDPGMPDDPADPTDPANPDNPADPADEEAVEAPSFENAAQAMHAANLAEAAAAQPSPEVEAAKDGLQSARDAFDAAEQNALANPDDPAAQEALAQAQADLDTAREAYSDAIADRSGALASDIQGMRDAGMGWGEIAHELGVHPGAIGLGHGKKKGKLDPVEDPTDIDDLDDSLDPEAEIAQATRRDTHAGWSNGHGKGVSQSGSAKANAGSNKGGVGNNKSSNEKGNSGNSGNNGNKGGNGNGKGKGKD